MSFTRKEYKLQIMAPCFISSLLTFDESAFERRKNNFHIRIQNSIEAAMNERIESWKQKIICSFLAMT